MERKAGMADFVAVTVFLVLIAVLLLGEKAWSGTDMDAWGLEEYYQKKEQDLTGEIGEFLKKEGLENSGIMVTRVVEENGSRLYTVTVHHGRIDAMDAAERAELLSRLQELNFADDRCSFTHEFLLGE